MLLRKTIKALTSTGAAIALMATVLFASAAPANAIVGGWNLDWNANASGMVSITYQLPGGIRDCSGAVIGNPNAGQGNKVLTAAHCFWDQNNQMNYNINNIRVHVGSNYPDSGSAYTVSNVYEMIYDEGPQAGGFADAVVLTTSQTVTGLTPFPYAEQIHGPGTTVAFNGYGPDGNNDNVYLRQAQMILTGDNNGYGVNGAAGCEGDSGGPVHLNGVVFGVMTNSAGGNGNCWLHYGPPSTMTFVPLAYTDIANAML